MTTAFLTKPTSPIDSIDPPQELESSIIIDYPTEQYEIVDGQPIEKNEMTTTHGRVQINLAFALRTHDGSLSAGGIVYGQTPCYTVNQRRRLPDVAYATPEFLAEFRQPAVLPRSFPLVAEIVSPTDGGEDIFLKAQEYLESGAMEVWLVFPLSQLVIVATAECYYTYLGDQVAVSPKVLTDFQIAVQELLK